MSIKRLGIFLFISFGLILENFNVYGENLVQALKQVNQESSPLVEAPAAQTSTSTPITQIVVTPSPALPKIPAKLSASQENYHDKNPHAVNITLADAIAIALRKNPNIDKAYLQRINDKFTFKLAQGQFEIQPTLTAQFNSKLEMPFSSHQASTVSPGLTLATPFGTQFAFAWNNNFGRRFLSSTKTLTITQPLLQGIGTDVNEINLKNANDQEILNKLTLKQTIISTITTVITDYRSLQQAEMNYINDEIALKISQDTVTNTKKRIKAGVAAASDIYQFQSQVANNQLTLQSDLNSLQQAKITLANDLGLNPNSDLIVTTQISTPDVVPNLALSQQLALLNDQSYLTDIINIRMAKRALLLARDNARWQLNLTGTVSRSSYGHQDVNGNPAPLEPANANDAVGLSLTVPLGNTALQNRANIVSSKISYQDDIINLENDKRKLINNVQQQIETINIDIKKLALAKQAVDLQKKTLETTTKRINAGLSSGLELTTAQQNLRVMNQSLIQARITYLNDLANFDQTVGTTLDTWKIKVNY